MLIVLTKYRIKDIPSLSLQLNRHTLSNIIVTQTLHMKYLYVHFTDEDTFLSNFVMTTFFILFFFSLLFENVYWLVYYRFSNIFTWKLKNLNQEVIFRFLDLNTRTIFFILPRRTKSLNLTQKLGIWIHCLLCPGIKLST